MMDFFHFSYDTSLIYNIQINTYAKRLNGIVRVIFDITLVVM